MDLKHEASKGTFRSVLVVVVKSLLPLEATDYMVWFLAVTRGNELK